MPQRTRVVGSFCLFLLIVMTASTGLAVDAVPQDDGRRIPLPAKDRTVIETMLGRGVVGTPLPAKPLEEAAAYLRLDDAQYVYRRTHGSEKGKTGVATLSRLSRTGQSTGRWKFKTDDAVIYGQITSSGGLEVYSSETPDQGVVSRYSPAEPAFTTGMRPGQTIKRRINVSVFDLSDPSDKKHSGHLDLEHTYIGAYEVTVPAGTFETVLLRWRYDGKVGPANVKDEQYWFLARDTGVVARIQKTDVSAFLVYQDHEKRAGVLLERRSR